MFLNVSVISKLEAKIISESFNPKIKHTATLIRLVKDIKDNPHSVKRTSCPWIRLFFDCNQHQQVTLCPLSSSSPLLPFPLPVRCPLLLYSLSSPTDSYNIYGCLEQTLAAGKLKGIIVLSKKTKAIQTLSNSSSGIWLRKSLVCFVLHWIALHQFSCGIAPCLKSFAGANAVWSLRQISPRGHQSNLVDLPSHANVNQKTLCLLCITNAQPESRMEGGATVQQQQRRDKLVKSGIGICDVSQQIYICQI